jgi:hypothetical protein
VLHRAARTAGSGLKSNPPEHWPRAVEGIIGSTIDAIGRPALRDIYNATLGDRMTLYRITNLANVFRRYQEATKDLPPEGRRFAAEKAGIRLIEETSLEDDLHSRRFGQSCWQPTPAGLAPDAIAAPMGRSGRRCLSAGRVRTRTRWWPRQRR